jgi:hypothetical protein
MLIHLGAHVLDPFKPMYWMLLILILNVIDDYNNLKFVIMV